MKSILKKKDYTRCKRCYDILTDDNKHLGLCDSCMEKEIVRLKRRIITSFVVSAVLITLVLLIHSYVNSVYYYEDTTQTNVVIPLFQGSMMLRAVPFHEIFQPSPAGGFLFLVICFFLPFSAFVQFEYKTQRYKAEQKVYEMQDPLVVRMVASSQGHRMDDVGLFIAAAVLSVFSGPYYFLYRFYRLRQLKDYIRGR